MNTRILHQLTAIWLFGFDNLSEFRSKFNFIGSVVSKKSISIDSYSNLGRQTVAELEQIDKREANGVLNYFYEMRLSFQEMYRVLKQGGIATIVIGNTELKRVKIRNVNVFKETMEKIAFKFYKTIKRPIPNRILPSTRDKKTGRFALLWRQIDWLTNSNIF